jgi:VanZ family protein
LRTGHKPRIDLKSTGITAGILVIIVYGSLYRIRFPLNFDPAGALGELLATWNTLSRPGDVLANIVFYLPFGFFLARSFARFRPWAGIAAGLAAGGLLSVSMEVLQYHIEGRHATMSDVYADTLGALLGATAAALSRGFSRSSSSVIWNGPALLLLACWVGYRLYPYVPVIDLHKYWDAVKPLLAVPELSGVDLYTHAAYWLTIGVLLEGLPKAAQSRFSLMIFFPGLIFGRILIAGIVLSPDEIGGGVLAVCLWTFWLWRLQNRVAFVAGVLAGSIIVQALEPFRFSATPRPFGWIPFRSLIRGSPVAAVLSFFEKMFAYGSLVWLVNRAGVRWGRATFWSAVLVMALRQTQTYIPGRSAEVTDVLLLLIVASIMWLVSPERY